MNMLHHRMLLNGSLFLLLTIVFTMAFWKNSFRSAEQDWFVQHQFDSEALVIGRLAETQLNGISSYEGRLGTYKFDQERRGLYTHEDYVYEHMDRSGVFLPYDSQIGFQGMLFSVLDQALSAASNIEPLKRKNILHLVASLLTALTISALIYFIYLEFGLFVALVTAIVALYSQWLIVFGKNLYWAMFFMYLPMVITCFWYRNFSENNRNQRILFVSIVLAIAAKSACGFEYLTTIVIAALSPIVYFGIKKSWTTIKVLFHILIVGAASIIGFVFTFFIHVFQQATGNNISFGDALTIRFLHAVQRLHKKVEDSSNEVWVQAGDATVGDVVGKYWNGEAFDLGYFFGDPTVTPVTFSVIIILLAILSPLVLASDEFLPSLARQRKSALALISVVWLSFLGTLSWYVFAKVHSYFHGHMNHVLWHLPFTFFASTYIAVIVKYCYSDYAGKILHKIGRKGVCIGIFTASIISIIICAALAFRFDSKYDHITQNGEKLIFSEDADIVGYIYKNKLVLLTNSCLPYEKENLYIRASFLPEDSPNGNADSYINFNTMDAPLLSSYKGACSAEIDYETTTPITFTLYSNQEPLGKAALSIDNKLTASPFTDGNWSSGVSRGYAGFFVENTIINRKLLKIGSSIEFAHSGQRKIISVSTSKAFINIAVSGENLNARGDGYPNIIYVGERQVIP